MIRLAKWRIAPSAVRDTLDSYYGDWKTPHLNPRFKKVIPKKLNMFIQDPDPYDFQDDIVVFELLTFIFQDGRHVRQSVYFPRSKEINTFKSIPNKSWFGGHK